MAATLADVARRAGVSTATASRAFSKPQLVGKETRERVLAAASELNYRPNSAARALVTGRKGRVGVIVPGLDNPFFAAVLRGAANTLHPHAIQTVLGDFDEDPTSEAELISSLVPEVDGLILCSSRQSDADLDQLTTRTKVVLLNRRNETIPNVHFDNRGGIQQLVGHLRALGHTKIGYIAGPLSSRSAVARQAAFEELSTGPTIGSFQGNFDGGALAADRVLESGVSAVLAYNDVQAIGAMHRLLNYGATLPERLSIVGFDDIPIARMVTPSLTTVRLPQEEAGDAAAKMILEQEPQSLEIAVDIVVRRSTLFKQA